MSVDERAFEDPICGALVGRCGYTAVKRGNRAGDFDAALGLDTAEVFTFVRQTQPQAWRQLAKLRGGDEAARSAFAARLAQQIDARGTIDVLRTGVVDLGVSIKLAYFRPAHGLTPEMVERYAANRLTVTRQLPFDAASGKTVDLGLFVNGLPVATAELKGPLKGQTIAEAKQQYRTDRDPKNVTLSRRAVVHFAVDTEQVAMTTRLAGDETQFLPFNRGHDLGAGNPPIADGYRTSYLWELVWQRDAWLDLLQRFIHVDKPVKGAKAPGRVIFPRYHQWDAVLAMSADARERGPGHHYLVQHSAGSGKSNTIAWLSHRLSTLHDADDVKVFDKVIVITDRVVLDKQLQQTVYQFEQVHGVVEQIDQDSAQLAAALAGKRARIIVTTLQKFPFVLDHIEQLPERSYAIVVDEAHSSQTGDTATAMKKVLRPAPVAEGGSGDGEITEDVDPVEAALAAQVAARGRQPNLSFFAFTATPKGRTLELFGAWDAESGTHRPFHLYSMRQAIEEGFILDVLAGYVTYETFFALEKAITDDPEYDPGKASAAIAKYVSLHPSVLSQKAQIIVDHFRAHVAPQIDGRAKAMVVTSSRQHAVRMTNALRRYVDEHGYDNVGILVAFSGSLTDEGVGYTEPKMNGIPEARLPEEFAGDHWRFLVVADKYQTGFDQPLLYAMYVDKTLTGLNAVQTLSRLNRTHPGKTGTFVLDFANDAEDIRSAFEQWHGLTRATQTDPNALYDVHRGLGEYGVLWADEAAQVAGLLVTAEAGAQISPRVHAALDPAVDRFHALTDDEQDAFRDDVTRFVRTYAFLSQIVAFGDTALERDYLAYRALAALIRRDIGASLDLGSEVELTQLKLERSFEGSVSLQDTDATITTMHGGLGRQDEPEPSPLSTIIARLNERFGTKWSDATRLHIQAVGEDLVDDQVVQREAAANTQENFAAGFDKHLTSALVRRLGEAEEFTYAVLDDDEMAADVRQVLLSFVYGKAKVANQEHCPIADLLGPPPKESTHLEYKSTLRTHAAGDNHGEVFKPLESAVTKTVAAFLNGDTGGTLLIGVDDKTGQPRGLAEDFASLHKDGKDDRDLFNLHLGQVIVNAVGAAAATNVSIQMHVVGAHDVCRVHVKPCGFPVDATVTKVRKGQHLKDDEFYVRVGASTKALAAEEKAKYIAGRTWTAPPAGGS